MYVLTQYFVSCVHVRYYFSLPLIFTSLATSICHFLTEALNFHVFFLRNSSPLFSITRSSSFSVIHVSVNIKNNAEKDTTLLLFFLSKSPGSHVISFQIKPFVHLACHTYGLNSFTLVYLWCGRTVACLLARSVFGQMITKFSQMGRLPRFLSYGAPPTHGANRHTWSSAITNT